MLVDMGRVRVDEQSSLTWRNKITSVTCSIASMDGRRQSSNASMILLMKNSSKKVKY
jgi:hypothetical protein